MMKTIILMCVLTLGLLAQTVTVPLDSLPDDMKAKYQAETTRNKITENAQTVATVAQSAESIGKSVGVAMREGLGAISTEANKFASTPVGKFTAVIIAWKVLGDDVTQLTSGLIFVLITIPLFVFGLLLWVWSFKRVCHPIKTPKTTTTTSRKGTGDNATEIVEVVNSFEFTSPAERGVTDGDVDTELMVLGHWVVLLLSSLSYFAFLWNAIF